jgi:hypothetical protein
VSSPEHDIAEIEADERRLRCGSARAGIAVLLAALWTTNIPQIEDEFSEE